MQDDPKYKQAMRVKNHEARLRAFLAICGSMRTDDSGGQQPKYRMDTYRIMAEFEKPKVCRAYSSVLDIQSPIPLEHLCCPQRLSSASPYHASLQAGIHPLCVLPHNRERARRCKSLPKSRESLSFFPDLKAFWASCGRRRSCIMQSFAKES